MDNWLITKNNSMTDLSSIPIVDFCVLRDEIIKLKKRPIGFFGHKTDDIKLYVILADDKNAQLLISSCIFKENETSYKSITQDIPAFHMFEREFYEQFGIKPDGHPWLKPVRNNQDDYDFFKMEGEEVHEVAVGPIHAGVIEPGHFRFMCNGETVYHLEIMLGYQHKGIEEMMVNNPSNQLAESICGDSVIAHNLAYTQINEILKECNIPYRADLIRKAALEMERAAIHIGDLGAIAGDIGYQTGSAVFGATRTLVINTMLEISGSRFGRGLIVEGGVNFDIQNKNIDGYLKTLDKVTIDVERMTRVMLKNSTVMSRLEKTGTISYERAVEIGLTGMAARACGVELDSRFDFNDEIIQELKIENKPFKGTGDVNSRFKLRYKEIMESLFIIRKIFEKLKEIPEGYILIKPHNLNLQKNKFAVSITEGWRGEVVHTAITDNNGNIVRYKIKDSSFNNWYGLALAVRNNGISDFPLCNKSFNLSYSGNDL